MTRQVTAFDARVIETEARNLAPVTQTSPKQVRVVCSGFIKTVSIGARQS